MFLTIVTFVSAILLVLLILLQQRGASLGAGFGESYGVLVRAYALGRTFRFIHANLHRHVELVVDLRLHHLEDWGRPDLIILDGSVGQLSAIRDILKEANIPVIGRDKSGDHSKNARVRIVVLEGEEDYRMIELAPDSHIAKLIARIDDESHRFAIQYHTLLKRKDALK